MAAFPTLLEARVHATDGIGKEAHGRQKLTLSVMEPQHPEVPSTLRDITAEFVQNALKAGGFLLAGEVVEFIWVEPTQEQGFASTAGRVQIRYRPDSVRGLRFFVPPKYVIVKLHAESRQDRGVAIDTNNSAVERWVYERLAPDMAVPVPNCFRIVADPLSDNVVFVMEDLSLRKNVYAVDQWRLGGCSVDEANAVAHSLGKLHAQHWRWWGTLAEWLPRSNAISARSVVNIVAECESLFRDSVYFESLGPKARQAVEVALSKASVVDECLSTGPMTLLNHNVRADNLLWCETVNMDNRVLFPDWQMAGQGVGALDLAWFSSSSFLEPGQRSDGVDEDLVRVYWASLIENGVDRHAYPYEAAWRDYLLGLVWSLLVLTQVVKFGEPTPMLEIWVGRAVHAVLETNAHEVPCHRL